MRLHPDKEEARIQLLSYYSAIPPVADLKVVKPARLRHILWVIENDPKNGLGLFQVVSGVYRLNCQGDDLADAEGFRLASELWLKQVNNYPDEANLRRKAVEMIQFCLPEQAEKLLLEAKDLTGLGNLYASAVLGITGKSYENNDDLGSDPKLRTQPFAMKAGRVLEAASNGDFLVAAAASILRSGAILWADGKLDWDYTPLGNQILEKAKVAMPDSVALLTLPTTLPAKGERPPLTIRVGGNVQQSNLIRQVPPKYPKNAREAGIQGTVRFQAMIGLDGKIFHLKVISGPRELIDASQEAVSKWVYRPTLLNGKPCYVQTLIDVNYRLSF